MIRALVARLGALALTLLAIAVASFGLLRVAPGGPFDDEKSLPPEVLRALEAHYGLDLPLVLDRQALREGRPAAALAETQLGRYLGALARGDLGPSYQYKGRGVGELLLAGAPASAAIGLLALELALVVGMGLGAWAAARPGGRADGAVRTAAAIGLAVPNYVIALGLAALFGVSLRWLPIGGWGRPEHLVMPALALAAPHAAVIARLSRAALLETLSLDFIRTARAKGLGEARVVIGHALRPSLAPIVQYLGPAAAGLVTGSLAVEAVFQVPGMGAHFVHAALNRDYPLVMGAVLVYAALLLALNAAADLAAAWLDPRSADAAR